ncbi:MAG TPA: ATP-binding protein, partial [Candidatus Xenobia bacterium]
VQSRGGHLDLKMPRRLPVALVDADRLQQVITNLIENALKYGGPGPIRMTVQQEPGQLRVDVEDQGPGVANEDRQRIFGLFERGQNKGTIRGAGLGLFICKATIDAHGGHIGVDTGPGGRGARFYFTLPLEEP